MKYYTVYIALVTLALPFSYAQQGVHIVMERALINELPARVYFLKNSDPAQAVGLVEVGAGADIVQDLGVLGLVEGDTVMVNALEPVGGDWTEDPGQIGSFVLQVGSQPGVWEFYISDAGATSDGFFPEGDTGGDETQIGFGGRSIITTMGEEGQAFMAGFLVGAVIRLFRTALRWVKRVGNDLPKDN